MKIFAVNALISRYLQNIPAGIEDKEGAYVCLYLSLGACFFCNNYARADIGCKSIGLLLMKENKV